MNERGSTWWMAYWHIMRFSIAGAPSAVRSQTVACAADRSEGPARRVEE